MFWFQTWTGVQGIETSKKHNIKYWAHWQVQEVRPAHPPRVLILSIRHTYFQNVSALGVATLLPLKKVGGPNPTANPWKCHRVYPPISLQQVICYVIMLQEMAPSGPLKKVLSEKKLARDVPLPLSESKVGLQLFSCTFLTFQILDCSHSLHPHPPKHEQSCRFWAKLSHSFSPHSIRNGLPFTTSVLLTVHLWSENPFDAMLRDSCASLSKSPI